MKRNLIWAELFWAHWFALQLKIHCTYGIVFVLSKKIILAKYQISCLDFFLSTLQIPDMHFMFTFRGFKCIRPILRTLEFRNSIEETAWGIYCWKWMQRRETFQAGSWCQKFESDGGCYQMFWGDHCGVTSELIGFCILLFINSRTCYCNHYVPPCRSPK